MSYREKIEDAIIQDNLEEASALLQGLSKTLGTFFHRELQNLEENYSYGQITREQYRAQKSVLVEKLLVAMDKV